MSVKAPNVSKHKSVQKRTKQGGHNKTAMGQAGQNRN